MRKFETLSDNKFENVLLNARKHNAAQEQFSNKQRKDRSTEFFYEIQKQDREDRWKAQSERSKLMHQNIQKGFLLDEYEN